MSMLTRLERKELNIKGINVTIDSQKGMVHFEKDKKFLNVLFNPALLSPEVKDECIACHAQGETRQHAASLGTFLSQSGSAMVGLRTGFKLDLVIKGTGFKVAGQMVDGNMVLTFQLGYSNDVKYVVPVIVNVKITTPTQFSLESIDKQALGQVSAHIRRLRKVDPYKGKGIMLQGAVLVLKEIKKKK